MDRSFEQDIVLNKYKLEDECEKHSGVYHYYSDLLSTEKFNLDAEKDRLTLLESEVELEIRKNPPEDLPKITESTIKAYLGQYEKLVKQRNKINEIKKKIYHLDSAVTALEHKKSMISYLVTLYSMKYYSEPQGRKPTGGDNTQMEYRKNVRTRRKDKV